MTENEPQDAATDLTTLVSGMAQVAEVLKTLADAAAGYRRYLVDQGWSEALAEQLAAQALGVFQHRLLVGHQ